MKHTVKKLGLAFIVLLSFTTMINAQQAEKQKKEVALHQYCPVAYVAMNKAVKGNEKYSSVYKGETYYFANGKAKKMFDDEPDKYLPKYEGYCATGLAMGKKVESDPQIFSEYEGKTYLFSNKMAKEAFDKDPEMTIKKADENLALLANK